jgi:hypothetical protein
MCLKIMLKIALFFGTLSNKICKIVFHFWLYYVYFSLIKNVRIIKAVPKGVAFFRKGTPQHRLMILSIN